MKLLADHQVAELREALLRVLDVDETAAELHQIAEVLGGDPRRIEVHQRADRRGLVVVERDRAARGAVLDLGLEEERQQKVADGDLVGGLEDFLRHRLVVDERAVGAAEIADPPAAEGVAEHLGVAARDGVVVEEELHAGDAADDDVRLGEHAPREAAPVEPDLEVALPR